MVKTLFALTHKLTGLVCLSAISALMILLSLHMLGLLAACTILTSSICMLLCTCTACNVVSFAPHDLALSTPAVHTYLSARCFARLSSITSDSPVGEAGLKLQVGLTPCLDMTYQHCLRPT